MGGSNYRFSAACTLGPEGKPGGKAIVEALAQAYREVFQLPSGEGVFMAGQQADLEQRAADWAQGLMTEAGLALPKVEVNLETHAWVENSLRLYVDLYDDPKVPYELLVPVSDNGELDFSGIEQVAARIAQDWSQRAGRSSSEGLSARIAEQIGPDAREYAAWIIEVENNIRAEFWEVMNREMAGHLKKAEDLHEKAKKWRQDYDKWIASNGNISISVEGSAGAGAGGEFAVTIPKLPEDQKTVYESIWKEVKIFTKAITKSMRKDGFKLLNGFLFGIYGCWIIIKKSSYLIVEDVGNALTLAAPKYAEMRAVKSLATLIGKRNAEHAASMWDVMTYDSPLATIEKVKQRVKELGNLALEIGGQIEDAERELDASNSKEKLDKVK